MIHTEGEGSDRKMIINLCKFLQLVVAIQACPEEIPKRKEKLYIAYNSFKASSEDVISIMISASLERVKEVDVDKEDEIRRRKVIEEVILIYTKSTFKMPEPCRDIFLITSSTSCELCNGSLVTVKPSRQGRNAVVYTKTGALSAEVFNKHCTQCLSTVFPCYTEKKKGEAIWRKYRPYQEIAFFGVTSETYFESSFLHELTEDIFTCNCRFTSFAEKYNRLHGSHKLDKRRLMAAWLIFSIVQRLRIVEFPVNRDKFRNLDIEKTCKFLYPELRKFVDSKWLEHKCKICSTRILVMDGAAKIYRTVCAADSSKVTSKGSLNEFHSCSNSPLPGHRFCQEHLDDKTGDSSDRLDIGMMTRSKRISMGLDVDLLTTEQGMA